MASSVGVSRNNKGSKEYYAGFVPFVGPFVAAGLRATPNGPQNGTPGTADNAGTAIYLSIGVVQLLGAGLFFAGYRMPEGRRYDPCADAEPVMSGRPSPPRAARPCSRVTASFQPIVTPTFAGGGITGTF